MKIYGIYKGCDFEGGGVMQTFFKDELVAINELEKVVTEENEEAHPTQYFRKVTDTEYKTATDRIFIIERDLL